MDSLSIIFIALGLAMDSFAVTISLGATMRPMQLNYAFRIALIFGLFQAFMPLIGWLTGRSLREFITGIDHWVAFGLLFLIGIKMIYEAKKLEVVERKIESLNIYLLFALSIATSIDALVIGLSFALLDIEIISPVLIIGFVTFVLSFFGIYVGKYLGSFFQKKMEIAGGLVLITIGIKILLQHLLNNT